LAFSGALFGNSSAIATYRFRSWTKILRNRSSWKNGKPACYPKGQKKRQKNKDNMPAKEQKRMIARRRRGRNKMGGLDEAEIYHRHEPGSSLLLGNLEVQEGAIFVGMLKVHLIEATNTC
jgi:hypothetical protein